MANDEVLGPRKTMFVLVIVVGCFAVLWPRILSPLILGHTSEQLKPNKFDRETAIKQERSPIRMGPHPALLERGRAIPPGPPPPARPVVLPPHVRVRSPLSVYYDFDIKPPPIPGMRPPLGSPGGPVPAPKSSMGFVMPIYTICIIVFFVYTLSKILFKRTGVPYDPVTPDPQFRRRVFRDDSRTSPDRLVVSAISGLVAEVRQQMEASNTQNQQRQEVLDNARPFTNGNLLFNSSPVKIVACEYIEPPIITVEQKDNELSLKKSDLDLEISGVEKEDNVVRPKSVKKEKTDDEYPTTWCGDDEVPVIEPDTPESPSVESMDPVVVKVVEDAVPSSKIKDNVEEFATKPKNAEIIKSTPEDETNAEEKEESDTFLELFQISDGTESSAGDNVTKLSDDSVNEEEERREPLTLAELVDYHRMQNAETKDNTENQSVKVVGMEMTAHPADGGAWRENPPRAAPQPAPHKADVVKSIFLETEIPQQSRVLVSEFAEDRTNKPKPSKHAPLVVSGKMTLSLIQDAPRDTPDRDLESTFDDYTTASGLTQPVAERDDLSDEEIEEEIEIEEIEEIEESEEDEVIEPEGIEKK